MSPQEGIYEDFKLCRGEGEISWLVSLVVYGFLVSLFSTVLYCSLIKSDMRSYLGVFGTSSDLLVSIGTSIGLLVSFGLYDSSVCLSFFLTNLISRRLSSVWSGLVWSGLVWSGLVWSVCLSDILFLLFLLFLMPFCPVWLSGVFFFIFHFSFFIFDFSSSFLSFFPNKLWLFSCSCSCSCSCSASLPSFHEDDELAEHPGAQETTDQAQTQVPKLRPARGPDSTAGEVES